MHEPTFRAASQEGGVNPYQFEMANIREQCSWVHHDRHEATEKAKALVYAAVMKAARLEPLEEREAPVTPGALVVGGGVAGMVAALDIADAGFPVHLVEQSDRLGGRVAELNRTFPDLEPVACPFCMAMLDDAVKVKGVSERLKVMDIAELVAMAL